MVGKVVYFRNRKSSSIYSHAAYYFPDNMKTDSMPSKKTPRPKQKTFFKKTPDILTVPTLGSSIISLIDTKPIPVRQRLDVLPDVSLVNLNDDSSDCESIPQISNKIQQLPHMNQMVSSLLTT